MAYRKHLLFCLWLAIGLPAHGTEVMPTQRSASATELVKATRAPFGVWIDPTKWKRNLKGNDLFVLEFYLADNRDVVGLLNAESTPVPLDTVVERAIERFKKLGLLVKTKDHRIVSGHDVLRITFQGVLLENSHAATFIGFYYSGPQGTVQAGVAIPTDAVDKYAEAAESFLNGLQIGNGDSKEAKSSSPEVVTPNPANDYSNAISRFSQITLAVPQATPSVVPATLTKKLPEQAKNGNAHAQYLLALLYAEGKSMPKDEAQAVELMEKAATAHLSDAEAALGWWYVKGNMVPVDREKAERLLRRAAEAGNLSGQVNLACLLVPSDPKAAIQWFQKAAEQQSPDAEFCLSLAYREGQGVEKNEGEELKWLRKAAEHGKREAIEALADRYYLGRGVPKSIEDYVKWIREAARAGSPNAQKNLGLCCWKGTGMPVDQREAVGWFRKAAEQGEAQAQVFLAEAYRMEGPGRDYQQATFWYEKAAHQGNAHAQFLTAVAYLQGSGVQKNEQTGVDWLRKAADNGELAAQADLGSIYYKGKGVKQDLGEALKWFQKAAEGGEGRAQYMLGRAYYIAEGVDKNSVKAVRWLRKSADQGQVLAQAVLGHLLLSEPVTPADLDEAAKWLHKAAERGDARAELDYGICCLKGMGQAMDREEAMRWFRFSALQGIPMGQNNYGKALADGDAVEQDLVEAYKWYSLAIAQDQDPQAKKNAEINLRALLPQLTPEQINKGKKRAAEFVPIVEKKEESDPYSIGVT